MLPLLDAIWLTHIHIRNVFVSIAWWKNYRRWNTFLGGLHEENEADKIVELQCSFLFPTALALFKTIGDSDLVSCAVPGAVRWNWNFYSFAPQKQFSWSRERVRVAELKAIFCSIKLLKCNETETQATRSHSHAPLKSIYKQLNLTS